MTVEKQGVQVILKKLRVTYKNLTEVKTMHRFAGTNTNHSVTMVSDLALGYPARKTLHKEENGVRRLD